MVSTRYNRALGLCDICGFKYYHDELRKNWQGLMVCRADFDPKPDLLEKPRVWPEGVPVRNPRPDGFVPQTQEFLASVSGDVSSSVPINVQYIIQDQDGVMTWVQTSFTF